MLLSKMSRMSFLMSDMFISSMVGSYSVRSISLWASIEANLEFKFLSSLSNSPSLVSRYCLTADVILSIRDFWKSLATKGFTFEAFAGGLLVVESFKAFAGGLFVVASFVAVMVVVAASMSSVGASMSSVWVS